METMLYASIFLGLVLVILIVLAFVLSAVSKIRQPTRGAVVAQVIEVLRGLDFEVDVEVDEDGTIFAETTQYDSGSVTQSEAAVQRFRKHGNLVAIHNHPGEDVPPSVQDLYFATEANFAVMVVVTPHSTYYLPRPMAGWKPLDELAEAVNKYRHLFQCRSVGEQEFVGIDADGALLTSAVLEIASTDAALEAVFAELGYFMNKVEEVED